MDRRDFIKTGVVAGTSLMVPGAAEVLAGDKKYDLVAVRGGEPVKMFQTAIAELGGMKTYIRKGAKVVVKPNIGWDVAPERAGNTNPELIGEIIRHCYAAGAKQVFVFDKTCDNWNKTYKTSGIEKAAKDAGATVVSGDSESNYKEIEIKGAKVLKTAKVHELILNSDVFINVPILKHHSSSKVTIGMKNMMGVIWDRRFWHRSDLHQCIADFSLRIKPNLTIIDAYRVLKQNGPRGVSVDDVVMMKALLISTDVVAADAAAAKLFGIDPDEVDYIKFADSMGIGTNKLDTLSIKRIKL